MRTARFSGIAATATPLVERMPLAVWFAPATVNTDIGDQRYHRPMSENPPSGPSNAHGPSGFPAAPGPTGFPTAPAGSPPWPPAPPRPSRWPTFAALTMALIATGLAVVGWFRPPQPAPPPRAVAPTYTEQQISDAKTRACSAFEVVQKGVTLQTNEEPSADPAMRKAQAADGQLSVVAGGWYLRDHVEPATPPPVATAVQHLANLLLDLGANYIAGEHDSDPPQATRRADAVSAFEHVGKLCK